MAKTTMTPMLRQYRELKERYPDALLLFRLGDFYELFEDDAKIGARELGLVLTARRFSKTVRLPMCGVPYRTAVSYVDRLLKAGHKVAIAEQLEDARRVKGLVKRDVVRVVTPGTVVEDDLLPDRRQNFLATIVVEQKGSEIGERGPDPTLSTSQTGRLRSNLEGFGLAVVDLSTGEFAATEGVGWAALAEELQRIQPTEIVLPACLAQDAAWVESLQGALGSDQRSPRLSSVPDAEATGEAGHSRLTAHFRVASLEGWGAEGRPLTIAAAGAALFYLQKNQIHGVGTDTSACPGLDTGVPKERAREQHTGYALAHLRSLSTYSLGDFMGLDATTRRNLELTRTLREGLVEGSLLSILDRSETAMGARLLRRWIEQPLLDLARIHARHDAVGELVSGHFLRGDLRKLLDGMYDVERLVGRVGFGNANARDLMALRRSLARIPGIKALLGGVHARRLRDLDANLDELSDVVTLIGAALVESPPILIREGGLIRPGYNATLDALHATAAAGRDWLAEFEADERERTGIPNLRVKYNQVFGFFIEVTKSHLAKVPAGYERRATVRGAERFVTPALRAREAEILAAEDRADDLEYDLFIALRRQVAAQSDRLLAAARVLAELDTLAALAEAAARYGYVRPEVDDGHLIDIREGRHPVVERMLPGGRSSGRVQPSSSDPLQGTAGSSRRLRPEAARFQGGAQDRLFVPNDTRLSAEERLLIITGPNMAGKSVLVRQVALIVLMSQMGSFVPARSAHIGLADRIFTRVGATDDITHGRSTFLVEMGETAHILTHAATRSLVILDEVGRGTSTYDGLSLAWAVATDLHDRAGARTLFATHYHELTELPEHLDAARNYNLSVVERDGRVIFLRRLVPGGADRSYGLYVARLAGVPEPVVAHAAAVMARLANGQRNLEMAADREKRAVTAVREVGQGFLLPADDEALWSVVRELYGLDIANLTPVQALVTVNEWQGRLKGMP